RPDLALESAGDDVGGAHAGRADVDVGIGVKARHHRGVAHDVVVDIGVHVERHAHRRVGVDFAQAAQQVAFGVFDSLGDHGAVQVEQDGVVAAAPHFLEHQPAQAFVGVRVGGRAGPGLGRHRHDDLRAFAARDFDIAAQAAVGVFVGTDGAFAGEYLGTAAKEAFERRRHRGKSVGL